MCEANKILNMIAEVNPDDKEALDEIDARVWCYVDNSWWSTHGKMEFISFCEKPDHLVHPEDREEHEYNRNTYGLTKAAHIKRWAKKYWWKTIRTPEEDAELIQVEDFIGRSERYTRSRDAIKKIRPDGWRVKDYFVTDSGWDCWLDKWGDKPLLGVEDLPTEELAELHAIIQAIEYDRKLSGEKT